MNAIKTSMSGVRKGWLLISVAVVGLVVLSLAAFAVIAAGQGADFDEVLNEPARAADDAATISWFEGEPLLRSIEPQTRVGIEFAWTRALSAVRNAATDGDVRGVDIWFSGPAQDQVHELLATGAVLDGGSWLSHDITTNFYSIDGQILVVDIDRNADLMGELEKMHDTVRVVFILRDGNWRVEHLTRLTSAS